MHWPQRMQRERNSASFWAPGGRMRNSSGRRAREPRRIRGTATAPAATAVISWRRPRSRGARGALEVQVKLDPVLFLAGLQAAEAELAFGGQWRAGSPGAKASILQISVQSPQSGQRAVGRRRSREKRAMRP